MKKKNLRSGFTTGACAAAAAKAAVLELMSLEFGVQSSKRIKQVEIPFPDGRRHKFKIQNSKLKIEGGECIASASVIKYAGDDPDVTHGAEIIADVRIVGAIHELPLRIDIKGGKGVGKGTKPGLPVPIGEAAINPVPRQMIRDAVMEAILESAKERKRESAEEKNLRACELTRFRALEITISVPRGEELAKKTLNHRLGIVGGISILGTTGIVKPVSTEAWTATISSSMDVAKATGQDVIVLSAGRTSEKAHMKKFQLPEEAYVLMGDHLEYSLKEAGRHGFRKIHLCAQWAKMVKIAMATPQTHVRFGAIDIKKAVEFLNNFGFRISDFGFKNFNTAREIFEFAKSAIRNPQSAFSDVCNAAKKYADGITGETPIVTYLVSYDGEIIASSE